MSGRQVVYWCWIAGCVLWIAGCGGSDFPVRPVKGTVLCGGQPVTTGSITFIPIDKAESAESGKPASAAIAADGSFTLSTYDRFDGAIVGKHRVEYTGSEGDEEESEGSGDESTGGGRRPRPAKVACVQRGEIILEVSASSENVFEIDLTKPTGT